MSAQVDAVVPLRQECMACVGSGWIDAAGERWPCPCCHGVGSVEPCERCEGTGHLDALGVPVPCVDCEGVGQAGAQEYV